MRFEVWQICTSSKIQDDRIEKSGCSVSVFEKEISKVTLDSSIRKIFDPDLALARTPKKKNVKESRFQSNFRMFELGVSDFNVMELRHFGCWSDSIKN